MPLSTTESVDTVESLDGASMSCQVVRFLPYDVQAISDSAWHTRPTRSDASCSRTVMGVRVTELAHCTLS